MKEIILIGGGGHCLSCLDVINNQKIFKVKGIVDKQINKNIPYKLIGQDNNLADLRKKYSYAFITIGQIKNSTVRENIFQKLKLFKFKIPNFYSKYSYISKTANILEGSIILHKAVLNAYCSIGSNSIINTSAIIEHEVKIGNNCHISTNTVLNGSVQIGDNCFIGSNSIIREGIKIGKNSIIGAGMIIKKNIPKNSIIK